MKFNKDKKRKRLEEAFDRLPIQSFKITSLFRKVSVCEKTYDLCLKIKSYMDEYQNGQLIDAMPKNGVFTTLKDKFEDKELKSIIDEI